MNGWLSVEETARICGTDVQRITLWMNSNHIAFARFDTVLMTDKGRGRPGKHRRLLDTPLDDFGLSQRIVRACRELSLFTVEHLLIHLKRFRFARLYCVRNFGSQAANEVLLRLRRDGLIDGGGRRDFKVLHP